MPVRPGGTPMKTNEFTWENLRKPGRGFSTLKDAVDSPVGLSVAKRLR
jgi:hypothetical protein